jgi:hypothetical protein
MGGNLQETGLQDNEILGLYFVWYLVDSFLRQRLLEGEYGLYGGS